MVFEVGQTISHYRIVGKIGEGGMGVVYKGLDTSLNRHVAIKVLPAELTVNQERRLRFQREAQAAAALNHPNIGIIHEAGEHSDIPFLVMELVEGRTLREWIEPGPLALRDWFRVSIPIADGLAHAHKHGIVHRDLKPDNIMITDENHVKILDFGLAKLLEPDDLADSASKELHSRLKTISQELTREGKVFGTVTYMSPEQARGETVDHRSDLFSYGVLLYQMASGRPPFRGDSKIETLHSIIKEEPPPLSEVTAEIPAEAERVVRKAMEKEPDRRYQHADEMATDLRNLKRDVESDRVTTPTRLAGRPARSGWKGRTAAILAGFAIVAIALTLTYRRWWNLPVDPAVPADNPAIGVLGFENLTDPQDSENLSRILAGLITTDLAESGGLRIVSSSKVLAALQQAGPPGGTTFHVSTAPEAARRAGVDIMIVGQMNRIGDRLLLAAELVEVASGDTVGSIRKEARSSAEMFSLASGIATEIRHRMAPETPIGAPDRFDLTRALTASPEAYRYYASGQAALNGGQWLEAIKSFDSAIAADPTFALAYFRKGIAQWWAGESRTAIETLEAGLDYADRLPERWQIVFRATIDHILDRQDAAYNSLIRLIETEKDLPDAYYILGEITFHSFRHLDSHFSRKMLAKALEIDPSYRVVFTHLINLNLQAGDFAATQEMVDGLRRENPDDPSVFGGEMAILLARGKYEEAIRIAEGRVSPDNSTGWYMLLYSHIHAGHDEEAERLVESSIGGELEVVTSWALYFRGIVQAADGRFRQGIASIEEALARDPMTREIGGLEVSRFLWAWDRIRLLELTGEIETAIGEMRKVLTIEPDNALGYYGLGSLLLAAGRRAEAEETLERLRALESEISSPMVGIAADMLLGELHLADADISGARGAVERLARHPPENRFRDPEMLFRARLEAAAGDRAAAIAAYRELLEPAFKWIGWVPFETLARYELAVLEEETGDLDSARRHYREFLDRWGDADVELPQVIDARQRLQNLGAL
jgi:serine/threonine protein kinase/tetratricopeptide (TPR) repeat protein